MAGQKNKLTPLGKDIKKKLVDIDMSQVMRGDRSGAKYLTAICDILDLDPERYRASA